MKKLYNSRFIFIICISLIFIMLISFSTITLTKKNTVKFPNDGYIISNSKVVDFKSGTTYRLNLNKNIVFNEDKNKIHEISQDSFIHYNSGDVALLKTGSFVDLDAILEDIIPYYNITNKSIISYNNGSYIINNGNDKLQFNNILLRINDDKFLVAGKNLNVKIAGVEELLKGQYFEITFVEDGVVLIENNIDSYQVTADGSKIIISEDTIIDLSTKNILHKNEIKLNMTELTINGDENITIAPDKNPGGNGQNGNGQNGNGQNGNGQNGNGQNGNGQNGNGFGNGGGSNKPITESKQVSIDLVDLVVGIKDLTAVFQVNNVKLIKNPLNIVITNVLTNEEIIPSQNMTKTGYLSVFTDKLNANSNYMIKISEKNKNNEIEYYQRFFSTNSFLVKLEKNLITESELNYNVKFSKNAEIEDIIIALYDDKNNIIKDSQKTITKDNSTFSYTNLDSNTAYKIKVIGFKVKSATYMDNNGYVIKTVKTLKKKPKIKAVKVTPNEDKNKFILSLDGVDDPDASIKNYRFLIYNDPMLDEVISEINSPVPLIETEIGKNKIEPNKNYKFRVIIEYNDNEKNRELKTHTSSKFISTGASVKFIQNEKDTKFSIINGKITLKDPDCTVPMKGRIGCDEENIFSVGYYLNGIKRFKDVEFIPTEEKDTFEINNFQIEGLNGNTEYTMELIGNIKEEIDGVPTLINKTIIGNPFTGKTKEAESLKIEKKSDNLSNENEPINVTVSLHSNSQENTFINLIKTMKVTLYAKDLSNNRIQIGKEKVLNNKEIINLLYKKDYQLTNKFFDIEDINKLKEEASDQSGWLYSKYLVVFSDAYGVPLEEVTEETTKIEIMNNEIETEITKSFLLEYYGKEKELTNATVTPLSNKNIKEPNKDLDDTTIAGYKIDGETYVLDILRQYYGSSGTEAIANWDYVFYIMNVEKEILYKSPKQKEMSYIFYLDDKEKENFRRGNEYMFGFQIVVPDGVYPKEPVIATQNISEEKVIDVFNPLKQNPMVNMVVWSSTANSITFNYKIIKNIDDAFFDNKLFIVNSETKEIVDEQTIEKDEEKPEKNQKSNLITFNNLSPLTIYNMRFNKKNITTEGEFTSTNFVNFYFDGLYDISSDYKLNYKQLGNQLNIVFNNKEFVKRADMYNVSISSGNKKKEFLIPNSQLKKCDEKDNNCIIINYQDLEEFQGLNCKVDVKGYYENGGMGLNQKSDKYFVFKSYDNKYLKVDEKGKATANSPFADGLYTYTRKDLNMEIKNNVFNYSWNNDLIPKKFNLSITNNFVNYSNYGSYNPWQIAESTLKTDNNNFIFSGIIPMSKLSHKRKINNVTIGVEQKGLTKTIINNEFKKNDKKIYIDLYSDEKYSDPITISNDIDENNLQKKLEFKFSNLLPDHKYYYKVYANILNDAGEYARTELFDYREDGTFKVSEKTINTLAAKEIFDKNDITYESKTTTSKYMTRNIKLTTTLKDIDNYKLKYEITDEKGPIFESIIKTEIKNSMIVNYDISDNKFIFNNPKYKLKLTALTDGKNPQELVLYEGEFIPHLEGNNDIKALREPTFNVINGKAYVPTGENKYAIRFGVQVNDNDKVIKNADYYVQMVDDNGVSYAPVGYSLNHEGYIKLNVLSEINTILNYKNLTPDTYYTINIKANTYRNNYNLSEKNGITINSNFIQTGDDYNVNLGEGSLSVNKNILSINYKNATNLNRITKVVATVFKNNSVYGTYNIQGSKLNFINIGGNWKFDIDLSNTAGSLVNSDKVRVILRYYAKGLSGNEGLVSGKTYVNYKNE